MLAIDRERRDWHRIPLTRPCKVYNPRTGKYIAGTTRDLSGGGLMMHLVRRPDAEPGDRLYVAVAQKRRQPLIRAEEMIEAEVVRSLSSTSGETGVALRFVHAPQDLLQPARRAA